MTSLMTSSAAEIYKKNWTEIAPSIIKLMRRSKAQNAGQAYGHTTGI